VTVPQQKVEHFLTDWLENIQKPTILPRFYIYYRDLLHKHILPAIRQFQFRRLSPEHIEVLYAQKLVEGLSASTVHSMHTVLHKALSTAVRRHLLVRNVCNEVSLLRKICYKIHPFTPGQTQQFLAAVADRRLKVLHVLALATGMRLGELLVLKMNYLIEVL
jgi:integrase